MHRIATLEGFCRLFDLDFTDISVGIDYAFVDATHVEEVATRYHDRLALVAGSSQFLVDIALAETVEEKLAVVENLADSDGKAGSRRKWLYTELLTLYERRNEVDEIFIVLDLIWGDFEYEERMKHLVYYYPAADEEKAKALGKENIFEEWRRYLREEGQELSAQADLSGL